MGPENLHSYYIPAEAPPRYAETHWDLRASGLAQKSINAFCKWPDRKYSRLFEPDGLCCNYSVLLLWLRSSHRQYSSKWVWLCSNKTLIMDNEIWILYHFYVSQNSICLLTFFSNQLKLWKPFLPQGLYKNRLWAITCNLCSTAVLCHLLGENSLIRTTTQRQAAPKQGVYVLSA